MADTQVLVVDHDAERRAQLMDLLLAQTYDVAQAGDADAALKLLRDGTHPIIVCETDMPGKSGLYLLKEARRIYEDIQVILLSHVASSFSLLQALRLGAYDLIVRPIDTGEILFSSINRALEQCRLRQQNALLVHELEKRNASLEQSLAMMKTLNSSVEQLLVATGTQELLSTLLATAVEELKAERGFIALFDKDNQNLGIKISRGIANTASRQLTKSIPPGILTQAASQNKPALVASTFPPQWAKRMNDEERDQLKLGPGLLMAPLRMKNRVAGIVAITAHREGQPFAERDLLFLIQLSHLGSLALTREGRVYQQQKNTG